MKNSKIVKENGSFSYVGVIFFYIALTQVYSIEFTKKNEIPNFDFKTINLSNYKTQGHHSIDIERDTRIRESEMGMLNTEKQNENNATENIEQQEKHNSLFLDMDHRASSSILNIHNISKHEDKDQNVCVKTRTTGKFFICTYPSSEDIVSGIIQRSGRWEDAISQHIIGVLKQNENKPISFIDIGANIGYFSLLAAAAGHSVIAIEPWRRHVQKLTTSIQLNKFEKRILLIQNAVSNERREVKLDIDVRGNLGGARLISEHEHLNFKDITTVKSILLNDIVPLIQTPYVILKLDIEGHECRALEKAEEVFDNFTVLLILMEWGIMKRVKNKPGIACRENNIQDMVDMLTKRGFVPYSNISDERLDPIKNKIWKDFDVYWKPRMEKL